jgi:hypothetical protein
MNQWMQFVLWLWISTGAMMTVIETAKVLKGRSK